MAQIGFNDAQSTSNSNGTFNGPKFFSLKNDGDYAIVRFMYSSTNEFNIYTTHSVTTPKFKYGRTVSCVREPNEDIAKCPFCQSGLAVKQKMFVKMIEYVKQSDGTFSPEPRIWERPIGTAYELKEKMNLYGPLNQSIYVITRHTPDPNNKQTTRYSIDYAPAERFPATVYPNKPELFENYNPLGTALYTPSAEDMTYYLIHGDFPQKVVKEEATPLPNYGNQVEFNATTQTVTPNSAPAPVQFAPTPAPVQFAPTPAPTYVPIEENDIPFNQTAPWEAPVHNVAPQVAVPTPTPIAVAPTPVTPTAPNPWDNRPQTVQRPVRVY